MHIVPTVKRLIALVLVLSFVAVSPVGAQDSPNVPVDVQVNGATGAGLTLTAAQSGAFNPVTYSFTDQTVTGAITVTLLDNRGTNAGWSINIEAPDFVGTGSNAVPIPVTGLSLTPGTVSVTAGQVSPLPTASTVAMRTTSQRLMTAALNSGAGQYTVIFAASLLIPGNTPVDNYTTTLALSAAAAP